MTQRIIFLTGYKQSGKDTVADYLVKQYGFRRLAFADYLRDLLITIDPLIAPATNTSPVPLSKAVNTRGWEYLKKYFPEIYRSLLRDYGAAITSQDPNYFTRLVRRELEADIQSDFVITDTRFPAEFDLVRLVANGTLGNFVTSALWQITREGAVSDGHPSEQLEGMPTPSLVIKNDRDIPYLEGFIDGALSSL